MNYKKEDLSKIVCKYTKETLAHKLAREGHIFQEDAFEILCLQDMFGWTVAHEMAKQGYKFPEHRKDILSLKNKSGWSVAHAMATRKYNFSEDAMEILSLATENGWTVAHEMAKNGYRFPERRKDIITLENKDGWTVAHEMARNGYRFSEDRNDILLLKDKKGWTVAHEMAKNGYRFNLQNLEILKIKDQEGYSVAHEMASNDYKFPEHRKDILTLKDKSGWSVAHAMATRKYNFSEDAMDILSLATESGWTVAHEMAYKKYNFSEDAMNILSLATENGWTVAHEMASNDYKFPEYRKDILKLKNKIGWTVAHEMASRGYRFNIDDEEILRLRDEKDDITVAWIMARSGFYFPEKYKKYWVIQNSMGQSIIEVMFENGYRLQDKNKEILQFIYDNNKNTIAHLVAQYDENYNFDLKTDKDILLLENNKHIRVFDILVKYNRKILKRFKIRKISDINEENIEYFIRIIDDNGIKIGKITEALKILFLNNLLTNKIIQEKEFYQFVKLCRQFVNKLDDKIYTYFIYRTDVKNIKNFLNRFDLFYAQFIDLPKVICNNENKENFLFVILRVLRKENLGSEFIGRFWLNNPNLIKISKNERINILFKYSMSLYNDDLSDAVEEDRLKEIIAKFKITIKKFFTKIKAEDFLRYLYSEDEKYVLKVVELIFKSKLLLNGLQTIFDIISDQIPVDATYIFNKIENFLSKICQVSENNFTKVLLLDNEFINASVDLLSSLPELEDVKNNFIQNISQIKKTICDVF